MAQKQLLQKSSQEKTAVCVMVCACMCVCECECVWVLESTFMFDSKKASCTTEMNGIETISCLNLGKALYVMLHLVQLA